MLTRIIAAILDVFRAGNDNHDSDWMFTELSEGTNRELDPCIHLLKQRVLQLRRAKCKRPNVSKQLVNILDLL